MLGLFSFCFSSSPPLPPFFYIRLFVLITIIGYSFFVLFCLSILFSKGEELWETPIGTVIEGMENVKQFYDNYGDMPPWGNGPEQWRIEEEGINYMEKNYPRMDKFTTCTVNLVNPDTSNSQHFNRELLSKDSINMAQIQYKPKPHELKLSTQGNDNPIAASQPKDLSSFLSESILVKLIGIPLVVIMIFLFSQKKKRTDKKN